MVESEWKYVETMITSNDEHEAWTTKLAPGHYGCVFYGADWVKPSKDFIAKFKQLAEDYSFREGID